MAWCLSLSGAGAALCLQLWLVNDRSEQELDVTLGWQAGRASKAALNEIV